MRWNDLSDGSIKTFLILILLVANIAVAVAHRRAGARSDGTARNVQESRAPADTLHR